MTDKFNIRIEGFLMPDGRITERRTQINPDGSLGEIHGAEEIIALSDTELEAAGVVKLSEVEST